MELADKSRGQSEQMVSRTTLANAQHQAGELTESRQQFKKSEVLQKKGPTDTTEFYYSLWGFYYYDLLLASGEWREVQQRAEQTLKQLTNVDKDVLSASLDPLSLGQASLQQALDANAEWIKSEPSSKLSLDLQIPIKLTESVLVNNLLANKADAVAKENTLDDASLSTLQQAKDWLDQAVEGLRKASHEEFLPRGLLARACYYRFVAC
ncbi:MAG: hypothetical protein KAG86_02095, partial [Gammaproteobacteria bacterium]|nr:hypothetical protein [Gammaproteobacteria bacterium]